jgi:hypothetical protein
MSTPTFPLDLTAADEAIIEQLRRNWRDEIEGVVSPIRKKLDALAQRSSRLPGSTGEPGVLDGASMSLARQLHGDDAFQMWLKSSKTPHSGFATDLRLPPNRKAAGPISGISPTEYLPSRIWGAATFPLRLRSLMPVLPVTSGKIEYTQETSWTPSAAIVPETTLKPQMAAAFTEQTASCVTIAQFVKLSTQSLADCPLLTTWLDLRLSFACNLAEESTILLGDATHSIPGLMTIAPAFAYAPATGDNVMDVIARAAGDLMGRGYTPTGVVMNSADYTSARLLKSTIGTYLFLGERGSGPDDENVWELQTPLLWQIPLVISPAMPQGQFLVADFQQCTILFSRETLAVMMAFQNEDDFVRNLVTLRGELRSGLAVPIPAGLLKGTLPSTGTASPGVVTEHGSPTPGTVPPAHTTHKR